MRGTGLDFLLRLLGIAALVVLLLPVQGRIQQGRQMRSQFFQFRLGGLRAFALGSRFRGFDHEQ